MTDSGDSNLTLEELEAAKVAARRSLLAQYPDVAQAIADQTLYPQLWTLADSSVWEERLPRESRSFDDTPAKE
jgi:hypothetical protein